MSQPQTRETPLAGGVSQSNEAGGFNAQASAAAARTQPVRYSRGARATDNTPEQRTADTFAEFLDAIAADRGTGKGQQYICAPVGIAPDDEYHRTGGNNGSFARAIGQPHRCHKCVLPVDWLGLDADDGKDGCADLTPESFAALVGIVGKYSGVVYTTASHTPDKPRCRIVLELDQAAPRAERIRASQAIRARIDADMEAAGYGPVPWDDACDKPEQMLYLPVTKSDVYRLEGDSLCLAELLAEVPPEEVQEAQEQPQGPPVTEPTAYALRALESAARAVRNAPPGDRNKIVNREAHSLGGFVPTGQLSRAVIEATLLAETAAWNPPDKTPDKTRATIQGGIASGMAKPRTDGLPPPPVDASGVMAKVKGKAKAPAVASADELLQREFLPVQWAINGIIPEGISILSGDPKIGKSWLLYQACVAVAAGRPLWGGREPEIAGDALMLALEDNDRRLQRRLQTLLPRFATLDGKRIQRPPVDRLHYATEWPRAEEGVAALEAWLAAHPECRLVVVDTVSAFRQKDLARNKSAYAADYEVGEMFKPLARRFSCAIVLVMHNRKAASDDALQMVSGTQGITGGVDNVLVMRRERGHMDAGLYVDGRDIEEPQEIAMRFDGGYWSSDGQTVREAQMSKERRAVIDAVEQLGDKARIRAIADLLPQSYGAVRVLVTKMVAAGQLKLTDGVYSVLTPPVTAVTR